MTDTTIYDDIIRDLKLQITPYEIATLSTIKINKNTLLKGLGKKMMCTIISRLIEDGIKYITLVCINDDYKLMNYYRQFGLSSYNVNNPRDMIADINDIEKYCNRNKDIIQINNANNNANNNTNTTNNRDNSLQFNNLSISNNLSGKNSNILNGGSNKILTSSIKHIGIYQTGINKGRLKKGYMYTGKFDKNGNANIIKVGK